MARSHDPIIPSSVFVTEGHIEIADFMQRRDVILAEECGRVADLAFRRFAALTPQARAATEAEAERLPPYSRAAYAAAVREIDEDLGAYGLAPGGAGAAQADAPTVVVSQAMVADQKMEPQGGKRYVGTTYRADGKIMGFHAFDFSTPAGMLACIPVDPASGRLVVGAKAQARPDGNLIYAGGRLADGVDEAFATIRQEHAWCLPEMRRQMMAEIAIGGLRMDASPAPKAQTVYDIPRIEIDQAKDNAFLMASKAMNEATRQTLADARHPATEAAIAASDVHAALYAKLTDAEKAPLLALRERQPFDERQFFTSCRKAMLNAEVVDRLGPKELEAVMSSGERLVDAHKRAVVVAADKKSPVAKLDRMMVESVDEVYSVNATTRAVMHARLRAEMIREHGQEHADRVAAERRAPSRGAQAPATPSRHTPTFGVSSRSASGDASLAPYREAPAKAQIKASRGRGIDD